MKFPDDHLKNQGLMAGPEEFSKNQGTMAGPEDMRSSPLWPQKIVGLFFHPAKFFSSNLAIGKTPYVIVVVWCYGIASAIDRVDQNLFREQIGRPRPGFEKMMNLITESWVGFWGWVLVVGAFYGLLLWAFGGWWYRVRLQWSGAEDPDPKLARVLYAYISFVYAGPFVLWAIIETFMYANYLQAYNADTRVSLFLLIFPFWSLISSYIGAKTLFKDVTKWKACLWFLILPGSFYFVAVGAIFYVMKFF